MIKISLLHASRQRPQIAFNCFKEWITNSSYSEQIQYILGLDDDDPTVNEYIKLFVPPDKPCQFIMNCSNSRNVVQALNNAVKCIDDKTEIIMSVSDDQGCFKGWDDAILKCFKDVDNFKDPKFLGVSDGMRSYGNVLVYYISNRAYYNKFKYILYPEYDGVFADSEMTAVARKVGIINAPYLKFQHKHYTLGLTPFDKIYAKNDGNYNKKSWESNKKIYEERSKRNFDL